MKEKIKKAIENYQCSGCVEGSNIECFKKSDSGVGCGKHCAGTRMSNAGRIFLGMPKGFCRLGQDKKFPMEINIFEKLEDGWGYDKLNVPVWKYLDEHGNTLVRGLSPRINKPFLHVFLEDSIPTINCLEITKIYIDEMD